jgi:hypothetical protein
MIATLAVAAPVSIAIAVTIVATVSIAVAITLMALVVRHGDGDSRGRDVSSGVGALHRNRVDPSLPCLTAPLSGSQ